MLLEKRIKAFKKLSKYLVNLISDEHNSEFKSGNKIYDAIELSSLNNKWFSVENIKYALLSIGNSMKSESLQLWLKKYKDSLEGKDNCKKVGVIMAGNIPLVGFNDFFYVLMSGNKVLAKLSSDDKFLLPAIVDKLIEIEPEFKEYIFLVDNLKSGFDAVIATGSNNSSRYFEYYFKDVPYIIRKNRNSIAVISGKETSKELVELGKDIFMYYGLGCRNVSKIFLPENYFLERLVHSIAEYKYVLDSNKYCNNYNYHKSIFMINQLPFFDSGFAIYKEDEALASPVSVIHYECYKSLDQIKSYININKENLQCLVSNIKNIPEAIPFGQAQSPGLSDYADNIDVMEFLINI